MEVIGRTCAVGIFVVENVNHLLSFEHEVSTFVAPAIRPLPLFVAYAIHGITISLGLFGSIVFLTGNSTLRTAALRILAIFMVLITWSWWFRRFGSFIWDLDNHDEKRMRTIHCLKNLSIFGFIMVLQRVSLVGKTKSD